MNCSLVINFIGGTALETPSFSICIITINAHKVLYATKAFIFLEAITETQICTAYFHMVVDPINTVEKYKICDKHFLHLYLRNI